MRTFGDSAPFSSPLSRSSISICAEKRRLGGKSDVATRLRYVRGNWDRGIRWIGVNVEGFS